MSNTVECEHCGKVILDHAGCYRRAKQFSSLQKQLEYTEIAYNDLRKQYVELLDRVKKTLADDILAPIK